MNYNYDEWQPSITEITPLIDYNAEPISYQIEYNDFIMAPPRGFASWTIGDIELEWEKPPIDYLAITRLVCRSS